MNLEIKEVLDRGNIEKERLILRASEELDVGEYALFCVFNRESGLTNYVRAAYWFPDQKIGADESIALHTGKGDKRVEQTPDGSKTHFLFWNRPSPMWVEDDYVPVLVLTAEWAPFQLRKAPLAQSSG